MKTLPPQRLTDSTWAGIDKQLKWIFYDVLFAPLLAIINEETHHKIELKNSPGSATALLEALRSGRVQYQSGEFTGKFSVTISNALRLIGARFNERTKTYITDPGSIPGWILAEAAHYQSDAKSTHDALLRKLNEIQIGLDERLKDHNVDAWEAIEHIESGFKKSARALEVSPQLDDARAAALVRDYNTNIKLYIKDFAQQSIGTLREAVTDNAMQGFRYDRLKDVIKQRYSVTANKAKFLARQETALFMSKYRQQRFTQAGVHTYKWSTAHDERVRDDHKRLNGRLFTYDHPPITDRNTGARNNPGEDYNCRCLDIPILDSVVNFV